MTDDHFRYDQMVENALRTVVREALSTAAEHGLTGDHHFYLTFRTDWPGVEVSPALRQRYPREMTIVLQHRFWDLTIEEDRFSVVLTFNEVPETLIVPYAAIAAFADPSVRFGLQFASTAGEDEEEHAADAPAAGAEGEFEAPAEDEPASDASEKVVTLDRFRNKP